MRLEGRLDVRLLARIFAALIARHETLRTTFTAREGRPVQVITPAAALATMPLPVVSLTGLPVAEAAQRAAELARREALRPFDLHRGPLLRLCLLRLGGAEHLLLLTLHHIVSDGWSMGVLVREVAALYEAFAAGRPSPLPPLAMQYADFATWQRGWLRGEALARQLDHWRQALAGAPHLLELPTDRPRPAVPTGRGGALAVALPPEVSAQLAAFSRAEDATPFMSLLAGFGLLLGRWANQSEVLVGTPIANRNRQEIEGLIGFFVNSLALRVSCRGGPSFRELVARVRQAALDAYAHQDLPFERLVEEVVPERDLRHAPLFQVMFALQNAPLGSLELPGLKLAPLPPAGGAAKFDLVLTLRETAAGFAGFLEYSRDLFDATTVERLAARLAGLLAQALADPERPASELSLLLPGEREELARAWNDTARPYPRETGLAQLFAEVAAAAPRAAAILGEGVRRDAPWSYGRLAEGTARLAARLAALGVGPGTRVGVAMERSPDFVVAALAVLHAGGAYVPLDPAYPDERLLFMLEDTAAPLVLVHTATRERLAGLQAHAPVGLLCLDGAAAEIAACPPLPLVAAGGDDLAYVIYTSGSTGRPKGVAVSQRAVVRLVRGTDYVELGPADRVAHLSNLSFDAATFEIWGALLNGGAVVMIGKDAVLSPGELAGRLWGEGVSAIFLTTALFNQVVRQEPAAFGPLRHVLFGGEACDPAIVERFLAEGGLGRLLHVYGPTETTTFATWWHLTEVPAGATTLPIGRPLANGSLFVLDRWGQLAPQGQLGELHLGGDGLARGYLNRPQLTAERFVPDAWGGGRGERLYRTGDLVRQLAGGAVEFVGRVDHQVKIRGFRIELGEVEALLLAHPAVAAAVALAREDAPGERRLVAYAVPQAGASLAVAELRDHLAATLPAYMVPQAIVLLPSLPLTPNGKVDRRALPAPERGGLGAESFEAPSDPLEELLAGLWAEVLGVERVGVRDDFFALGGHSLKATLVASRVRDMLGVELPLRRLFESPTVAELAKVVRELRQQGSPAPPLVAVPHGERLPLSFAQQRLWFLDQLEPGSSAYNMPTAIRLRGELAVDLLRRILDEVARRHEALRTTFHDEGGEPFQRVHPRLPASLTVVDLGGAFAAGVDLARVRAIARAEIGRPFDLRRGPLLRLTLLRLGAYDHVLLITMHHVISDGWSLGVLVREVMTLYEAFSRGAGSPLPELAFQYSDYAAWQRSWFQGEVLGQQVEYWRGQLAGAPSHLELASDRPRGGEPSLAGDGLPVALPVELSQAVIETSRHLDVTPFMTLLTAYGLLLGRLAGQQDVLVGTPIANRNRREIEELIGFFVNTLVMRVNFRGGVSFRQLLARVRQACLDAYAHQDLPFERLVEALAPDRDLRYSPLFQVMFALQNAPIRALDLPRLEMEPLGVAGGKAKFDIILDFYETATGLMGSFEYDRGLFDRSTIVRLFARYRTLLGAALADPERPVLDLPTLSAAARQQVLVELNDHTAAYPAARGLGSVLAAVAAERGAAPAVVWEGAAGPCRWSYGDLLARAGSLAARLRAAGLPPGGLVGVAIERSPELVAAVAGVVLAGGAYVPLDPAYPDERLAFMVEDTGLQLVLTAVATGERLAAALGERPAVLQLDVESVWSDGALAAGAGWVPVAVPASALAYVIYTSGSTGRPKGVAVPQSAVLRLVLGTDYVELGPADRVAHLSSPSFDAATWELWGPLLTGGTVVVIEKEVAVSPSRLAARLAAAEVTALFLTTALFNQVVREEPAAFAGVRHVLFGGEACDPAVVRQALAGAPPERLLHVYGPTESTTFAFWQEVRAVPAGAATVPLGAPLANTSGVVVGRWGEPCGLGQVGELLLGGDGLAEGYLGRPALTAERFVPHPWGAAGARLYRTGDLVRRRGDGAVEFVGRADGQVKVRGFRIELGEVEAALAAEPGVVAAVVVAREEAAGSRSLVGYVVLAEGIEVPAVQASLARRLPAYMLPAAWVKLAALPLTANGKVDRRALPAPERGAAAAGYVAPADAVEELVAAVWSEVLGVERVGAEDDFFALGGHSLLATQVISRLRAALGVELPLRALFEGPTVAQLAAAVRAEQGQAGPLAPPLVPVPRDRELPLSFAQQRLWLIDQLEPGAVNYNMPLALWLRGSLPVATLRAVFSEVVRRHEALRTTFVASEGQPRQRIAPPRSAALPLVDLGGLGATARAATAELLAAREARRSFDLGRGPLLRLGLVRLEPARHLLLLTMHHIISDGWSMGVLVREIAALAAAFATGRPSPLPELAVQYADFATWQRGWLTGEVLEAQLAYWRQALAAAPQVLALPTDRPRPAVPSLQGATLTRIFGDGLAERLAAFDQAEEATPFMTLLAATGALLARLCRQDDLLLGTPIANRTRREIEDLIGFFVNTLVMRVETPAGLSFRQLVERVRQHALDAFAHQDLPFERLVEELVRDRDLTHAPLFQVMFALQNAPIGTLELPGLALEPMPVGPGTASFDLSITFQETAGGLGCSIEYSSELFDATTIERLLARLASFLGSALGDPAGELGSVSLLAPAERQQLLVEWNDAQLAEPAEREGLFGLHELVLAQVPRSPEAVALRFRDANLSYGELARQSAGWAQRLRALGVGPEERVGIAAARSLEMVVGALAILRAGGAFVPLDPDHPRERLAEIVAGVAPVLCLAGGELAERLPPAQPVVSLALAAPQAAMPPWLEAPCLPAQLAYVIHTSGSTGKPKGVMIHHAGIVNHMEWLQRATPLRAADVVLQKTRFTFDAAVWEVFAPLRAGARLVIAELDTLQEASYLARTVGRARVSVLQLVPSLLAALLDDPAASDCRGVARLMVGGEAFPGPLAARARQELPGSLITNLYGPTECSIDATALNLVEVGQRASEPIGRPVDNATAIVLDRRFEPVPPGAAGELLVGGLGLARGYWGRPAQTAERFLPNPWGAAGERLYRTGDLVRHLQDGSLEFLGRLDHQVKVRGLRIELGEIEAALLSHPAVAQAVVMPRSRTLPEGVGGDRVLVAYLTATAAAVEPAALREHLAARLPAYMLPAAFVVLDALPRTPNGKLDRAALPPLSGLELSAGAAYEPPRDGVEEQVAALWRELLGVERVGIHDDFFALGGHSLLATQMLARLRASTGVDLSLRSLFEDSTPAALARNLRARRCVAAAAVATSIRRRMGRGPLPLSFAQQRLWFIDQLEPASAAYNMPLALWLQGALVASTLRRVFREVERRHEVLRTTFVAVAGEPRQEIAAAPRVPLPVVDLRALAPADHEPAARRLAERDAQRPFDLARGPLLRLALVRLGPLRHLLLLNLHHIVSDGWSMDVLVRELGALFRAFSQGLPSPLAELPIQYADFAAWQREWLAGEELGAQLAYWRERLRGAPPVLDLATDHPRPAAPAQGVSQARMRRLEPQLDATLRQLARQRGATDFMLFLAAFYLLLERYTGQRDLVVGTPIAGRNRAETEGLIGFFVNTLALRAELPLAAPFESFLAALRERVIDDQGHQDLPFEKLVEVLQPERSLQHTPLFQVMLNVINTPASGLVAEGLELVPLATPPLPSKFDLTLTLVEDGGRWAYALRYRPELFEAATIERMLDHFGVLLAGIAAEPARPLAALPMLPAAEEARLSGEWARGESVPAAGGTVQARFAEVAARCPDAIALVCEDARMSYGSVAAEAARLAAELRRHGVGPEVRVGLLAERSNEMIVGLLAVLAAGGAYVPLDPLFPQERLAVMATEAGLAVVLAQPHLAGLLPAGVRGVALALAPRERGGEAAPVPAVTAANLAYVLFTSGSTGRPKGVAVEHRQLLHYTEAVARRLDLEPKASYATVSTLAADLGNTSVFPALLAGGTLHVLRAERAADAAAMGDYCEREGVDCLKIVPSHLRALTSGARPERVLPARRLVCGGEALSWAEAEALAAARPGCVLLNHYGPTETTVGVLTHRVDAAAPRWGASVPLGRPLANVRAFVVDRLGRLAPQGAPGELLLGGAGVSRGYLGRPAATAAAFVPNPFVPAAAGAGGERLYRTGDRVRHLLDGTLEFLGRIDQQVKIRGFRVEPGEVEAVLATLPEVAAAVVVAREMAPGDRRLVAFCVAAGEAGLPAPERLREQLRSRLPEAFVPALFVALPSLPLNANGKVDRRALAQRPLPALADDGRDFVPPETAVEQRLAGLWAELLGVERVGLGDNFFALGGHSLLATRLISRLREAFAIELPLRALFEAPTLGALAERVLAAQLEGQTDAELADLLAELEGLSEEEAAALAEEETPGDG